GRSRAAAPVLLRLAPRSAPSESAAEISRSRAGPRRPGSAAASPRRAIPGTGRARPATACPCARGASARRSGGLRTRTQPDSNGAMLAFVLRRLGQAVLVMLIVGLIAFSLFRFVGDPVVYMLGQDATDAQREEITRALGLDRPFYVQYGHFVANAVRGEFGLSLRQVQPV